MLDTQQRLYHAHVSIAGDRSARPKSVGLSVTRQVIGAGGNRNIRMYANSTFRSCALKRTRYAATDGPVSVPPTYKQPIGRFPSLTSPRESQTMAV